MTERPQGEEGPDLLECLDDLEAGLKEAQGLLDLGHYTCRACGSRRYHNFGHKQMNDALGAALGRVKSAQEAYGRE